MSSASNRDTVRGFYRAMAEQVPGEPLGLDAFFSPDARWLLPRSSPLHGKLEGLEAIESLFTGAVDDYYQPGSLRYDYHAEIADGDYVVMQFTLSAVTAKGDDYENDYCMMFRLENDRIVEVKEFFDTALLFSLLGMEA